MKWSLAFIGGAAVVALAVSLPRAQDESPAAEEGAGDQKAEPAKADAQAVTSVTKSAAEEKADAQATGNKNETTAAQDEKRPSSDASDGAVKSDAALETKEAPAGRRSQILQGRIVQLKHVNARLALGILKKEFRGQLTDEMQMELIPGQNSLLFSVPVAMYPPILETIRKLDQPAAGAADDPSWESEEAIDVRTGTNTGDAPESVVGDPDDDLKIFRLKNADATNSRGLLLEMYPAQFKNRSKVAADARTNSLVVRAPGELMNKIEAVLMALDDAETVNRPRQGRSDSQKGTSDSSGTVPGRAAGVHAAWLAGLEMAADPDAEVRGVREEYRRLDRSAVELARQHRAAQKTAALKALSAQDDPTCVKLKEQLQGTVQAAFTARQKVQQYELAQMRQRLQHIENRLTMREQAEQEIVRQRVEELLHPEREWEPAGEAGNSGAGADRRIGDQAMHDVSKQVDDAVARAMQKAIKAGDVEPPPVATDPGAPASIDEGQRYWIDFRQAKNAALKTGSPLLVHFDASFTSAGRKMKNSVLYDPEVLKVLDYKVLVNVTDTEGKKLAKEYEVDRVPSDLVFGGDGTLLTRSIGIKTVEEFVQIIRDARAKWWALREARRRKSDSPDPSRAAAASAHLTTANPRKELIDAQGAVVSALATISEEQGLVADAEEKLKLLEQGFAAATVPQRTVLDARSELGRHRAAVERGGRELKVKERQLELARENLQSQIRLLELDLEEAKLRLVHVEEEEARSRVLLERQAMSKAEYDEKKLAVEQAKLQISRISELISLYSKPIPGEESTSPGDTKKPAPEGGDRKDGEDAASSAKLTLGAFSLTNRTAKPDVRINIDFKLVAVTAVLNFSQSRLLQAIQTIRIAEMGTVASGGASPS